ncbi:MAG: autotransporter-associated beta strand repeat-containing protein [Moraxellaceae bacterium]|nr:autotransporter-associated beta strand repeat-containing protein [Moraxellaceae bacterium]
MRRPPFTISPLTLAVTVALTSPVAMAIDASQVASPTETNNVVLTATDNTVNVATEITGVVSDAGQNVQLIKQGAGTLSLTNNNTYQGGTEVQGGTLSVARAASLGDGGVTLSGGATLDTQKSTALTQNMTLSGNATISTTGAENITQVTSTVSGAGGLTKSGAGTLSLTADNAYQGNTTVQEGTLAISRSGSLGTNTTVNILNNATLKTNQGITVTQDVAITGQGKVDAGGNNSVLQGQIVSGTLEKVGNGSLTLDNENNQQTKTVINGGILVVKDQDGNGITSLGGGNVEIKKGTLQTNNDMTIANSITTVGTAGGSINTAGHDVTVNGQVTGSGRLVKTGGGTLTLTNTTNDYDVGTAIDADGKTVAVVGNTVINGGVLAVGNDAQLGKKPERIGVQTDEEDQYKWKLGNVQIDGGTLKTTQGVDSDRYVVIGNAGATVDVSGAANTTTLSGLVEGKGVLTKEGEGTLVLDLHSGSYRNTSNEVASEFKKNSVAGVSVKAGVLEIDNAAKDFGAAVAVNLAGGELRINQAVATGVDLGAVTLQGAGGTIDTTGATIKTGALSGSGALTKQGSGTLVLTDLNNQAFTGNTTISQGKIQINSTQGLGVGGQLTLDGGSLQVVGNADVTLDKNAVITSSNGTIDNVSNNVTLSGVVSGAGQLVKSGAGKFSLTNEKNNFEGGVRIKDGTLEVSTDGSLGKANTQVLIDGATLAIAKDATLGRQIVLTEKGGTVAVAGTNTATLSGTLSLDAGVLSADFTKSGTGTLNLTKDNTNFKGNTIIQEGTLGVTGKDNLAQGKLFLDGGNLRTNASLIFDKEIIINSTGGIDTALDASGNKTEVTVTSKIQGNGAFVKAGEGTLVLSADNLYAGGTQIKGGVLAVNKDSNLGLQSTDITLNGGTLQLGAADAVSFKKGDAASRLLKVGQEGGGLDIGAFDLTIETDISGDGTLTQTGTAKKDANGNIVKDQYGQTVFTHDGTLTLKGNNTVSGITVESGTLKIDANQNLGADAAQLTLKDGTTLDTTDANTKLDLAHGITVGDGINGATLRQDEDLSIRGLTGTGKATLKVDKGAKTLAFNGDSSAFAGNLLVQGNIEVKQNLGTGNVEFNQGVENNAPDSNLHITGNATFDNQFKLNGQTTINADKDTKSVFNKAVKDADYNTDPGNDLTVKFRTGSLVKTGLGEISLNAENLYSGNTEIQQGTVTVANDKALGTGNVTLQNSTILQSGADVTLANKVELVSGNVTLATPQINQSTTPQNTSLTLTDTVSGAASLTKTGVGTLTLNGQNSYTGATIIKDGKVVINNAAALGANQQLELNANAALSVSLQLEPNEQPSTVTLDKNITLKGASGSQAILNATGANVILEGTLSNDGITQVGIIKEGAGTLELSGVNTDYKGKTTIKQGNLAISEAENLGGKILVELAGGGLNLLKDITIGGADDSISITGSRGAINTAAGTNSELALAFKGQGLFVKEGEGQLTLSGTNTEFSGGVSIDKGILTITKDDSLGKKDTNLILSGGTLQTDGVTTLNRDVQLNQNSTINNIGASTVGLNRLQGDYALTLEGGSFNLKAKIDEKTDPDTVVNINQHNGTVLKNTNVIIGNDADLGKSTGKLNFAGGATLDVQGVQGQVVQGEDDPILNISTRNISVEGTNNTLDFNDFNVTLGELSSTLGKLSNETNTSITKQGAGDLILDKDNKNYKGTLAIKEGAVFVSKDNALGVGKAVFDTVDLTTLTAINAVNNIGLNGKLSIHSNDFNSSLTGVISGSGSLVKDGKGTLSLTQNNSYEGGTNVNAGKVAIDANAALGTGTATFAKDSELSLGISKGVDVANTVQLDGAVKVHSSTFDSSLAVVSGSGSLVKDGTGTLSLTQNNSYAGGTTITEGKVAIDADVALGTGAATFAQNTALSLGINQGVNVANALQVDGAVKVHSNTFDSSLDGVISGVGSVVKDGTGRLTLTGTNSYEGGTVVNAGTLAISQNANLGKAETGVTVSNATLLLNGDIAIERKVTLAGTAATIDTTGDSSIDDAVSGSAKLIKTGDGTLTLSTANTYAGGTQIAKGTLEISSDASLGAKASKFGVDVVIDDAATLALTGNVAAARKLNLTGTTATIETTKEGSSSSLSEVISGSAKLVKEGAGSLTLSGVNTYAGGTDIDEGTLVISQDGNLGKAGTGVVIGNEATLALNGNVNVDRTLALAGTTATVNTVTGSSSLVKEVSGSATLVKTGAGTLTLNSANSYAGDTHIEGGTLAINNDNKLGAGTAVTIKDATLALTESVALSRTLDVTGIATVDTAKDSNSSLDKAVNGSGQLVKTGTGTLELTQANSYSGGTAIKEGNVTLAANAALGTGAATFAKDTELSLGISKGVLVANDVQVNGEVDIHSGIFDSSLTGVISGTGSLVKDGAGQLNLTGANSYAGGTQVNAGKVALDANSALGTGAATFAKDTELSLGISKGISVANAITTDGIIKQSNDFDSSLTGVISGSGSLVKDGAGLLSLTGANSYAGGTQVNAGKVALDANTALGSGAATFAKDTELSLGISKGISVANAITTDGIIKQSNDFDSSLTGVISGTGSLVKDGAGQLNLTGANSYAGGTQVNAGKVALDANTALGVGSATFAKDTELSLGISKGVSVANAIEVKGEVDIHSGSFNSSLTGVISGSGSLVKDGAGQLNLTGANSYAGGTQVTAGKVALDANTALGTGAATFAKDTELSLGITKGLSVANAVQVDGAVKVHSGSFDSSLDGVVSGKGSLVKDGTGTLTLKGSNSYEGGTIVNEGTLAISQNANLGKAETGVTVSNATLLLNGDIAIERKVTLAGTAVQR